MERSVPCGSFRDLFRYFVQGKGYFFFWESFHFALPVKLVKESEVLHPTVQSKVTNLPCCSLGSDVFMSPLVAIERHSRFSCMNRTC